MNSKLSPLARIAVPVIACLFLFVSIFASAACHQHDYVLYEVIGTVSTVDIQISNPSGGIDEYHDMGLPWSFSYGDFENSYVYLYAHNNTEEGSITVNIYVNGKLFRTATSTGPYTTTVTYGDK